MKIARGQIKVARIDQILTTPHVRVWIVDCESKRPVAMVDASDRLTLHLYADEHTLRADRRYKRPTEIDLGAAEGWDAMCDAGRYAVRVVAWRKPRTA